MIHGGPIGSLLASLPGKHLPWLLFIGAVGLLGVFAPKSAGTAFMPLFIGAASLAFLVLLAAILAVVIPRGDELSA